MSVKDEIVTNFVLALRAKFEAKVNKETDNINGDYSSDNITYPTVKVVKNWVNSVIPDVSGKADVSDLSEVAFSGLYNDLTSKPSIPSKTSDLTNDSQFISQSATSGLIKNDGTVDTNKYLTQHQSLDGKTVSVEEQQTAETGYVKTYVIKQGGVQVGSKINIPKDFLVKSATVETCEVDDVPVEGYEVGDKYIDFVINTRDNTGIDEHIYINVKDFISIYTAGNGLVLANNEFSIGTGLVTKTMLNSSVQTSLGYADNWNGSPASTITNAMITQWNNAGSAAEIDAEVEAYLTAITTALQN